VLAALLAAIAALRLLWHDGLWLLLLLNNVSFYLYLPAWPLALAAGFARRWRLALLAVALAALHAHWSLLPLVPRTPPPAAGRTFTVVSANLLMVHEDPPRLADELDRLAADVYLLQELSPHWDEELARRGFWDRYPYNLRVTSEDSFGCAIASRLPVRDLAVFTLADLPQMRGVLQPEGGPEIALYDVHLLPPRRPDYYRYHQQGIDSLLDLVQRLEGKSFIVAGDFNATPDSAFAARMRSLSGDAWELAGSGFGFTWPNGMFALPSLRIDHLFVSPDLTVTRVDVGVGAGSDHRPLRAEIGRRRW
jgi:vancomycin resistance protein VanJ